MGHSIIMSKRKSKKFARKLAEWLFRDFEIVIEAPTEEEIWQNLEEGQESDWPLVTKDSNKSLMK